MKVFPLLRPMFFSRSVIKSDMWSNYSPKFYTGDHDTWGYAVVNFYNDMSYVVVF